jgi:RNA polymerase sigma-70 factor (ECF subfamily)
VRIENTPRAEMVDRQTFDRLMLDHLDGAQRFAVRLTGDAALAEELVQEALVRAAGAWQSFRGDSAFRTWLLQVVVNVFRDRLRARAGPAGLEDANDVADARDVEPAARLEARELAETVAACVSALSPRQREVIVLVAYEQLTTRQAAAVLGITDGNARTTLHLARESLKKRLAPYFSEERREA